MTHRLEARRAPLLAALVLMLALFALLGCTPGAATAEPGTARETPADDPAAPPQSRTGPTPTPGEGGFAESTSTLTIDNQTGGDVCFVHVTGSNSQTWGPNQLPEDYDIPPGGTYTFENVEFGSYDLLIGDCDENPLGDEYSVLLGLQPLTWVVEDAVTLALENASDEEICAVHLSQTFASSWGPARYDSDAIAPGGSVEIDGLEPGTYDILLLPCDAASEEDGYEIFQFEIEEGAAVTFEGE